MKDLSEFRTALNALDMDRRHKTGDPLVRDAVWFMTDGHCADCKGRLSPGTFHVDHVKPAIRRGEDHITNYQPLCRSCNTSKGENSDIEHRSDEVRWLLGIGDEPEKLRAEREARLTASRQRLDDTFGGLTPTRVVWRWENEERLRQFDEDDELPVSSGYFQEFPDIDAVVTFEFDDDSQSNDIRRLLEMFRADKVDQYRAIDYDEELARLLRHKRLGEVFFEFQVPPGPAKGEYRVTCSVPERPFLAGLMPDQRRKMRLMQNRERREMRLMQDRERLSRATRPN